VKAAGGPAQRKIDLSSVQTAQKLAAWNLPPAVVAKVAVAAVLAAAATTRALHNMIVLEFNLCMKIWL